MLPQMQGVDEDLGNFIAESTRGGFLDNVEGGAGVRDYVLGWTELKATVKYAHAPDSPIKRRKTPDGSVTLPQQRVNFNAPLVSRRTMKRVKSESSIPVKSISIMDIGPVAPSSSAIVLSQTRSPLLLLLSPRRPIRPTQSLILSSTKLPDTPPYRDYSSSPDSHRDPPTIHHTSKSSQPTRIDSPLSQHSSNVPQDPLSPPLLHQHTLVDRYVHVCCTAHASFSIGHETDATVERERGVSERRTGYADEETERIESR